MGEKQTLERQEERPTWEIENNTGPWGTVFISLEKNHWAVTYTDATKMVPLDSEVQRAEKFLGPYRKRRGLQISSLDFCSGFFVVVVVIDNTVIRRETGIPNIYQKLLISSWRPLFIFPLNVLLTPLVILPKAETVEWPGTTLWALTISFLKHYLFIYLALSG